MLSKLYIDNYSPVISVGTSAIGYSYLHKLCDVTHTASCPYKSMFGHIQSLFFLMLFLVIVFSYIKQS